jgi:hypothetical protein
MSGKWDGGKGDRQRRVDIDKYRKGFDAAFNRCSDHPTYKVLRPPTADCIVCRRLWRERSLNNASD